MTQVNTDNSRYTVTQLLIPHKSTIEDLRLSIDYMDEALIRLLAERFRSVAKVCVHKNYQKISPEYSTKREEDFQKTKTVAEQLNLNIEFIQDLFQRIYKEGVQLMDDMKLHQPDLKLDDLYYDIGGVESIIDSIFHLDLSICYLLAERFRVVSRVGIFKKKSNLKPLAVKRWEKIIESRTALGSSMGLHRIFVVDLLNLIHKEALRMEANIIGG
ncbi:MAG: chorismate mutase [bacterium]|jgi:chorismate mutase